MPLSYRLLTQRAKQAIPDDGLILDEAACALRHNAFVAQLSSGKVPIIDLSNVAEWYASSDKQVFDFMEMPSLAPPFSMCFYEWEEPKTWNMGGEIVTAGGGQFGMFSMSLDLSKASDTSPLDRVLYALSGGSVQADVGTWCAEFTQSVSSMRWITVLQPYATVYDPPASGIPIACGFTAFIGIGADGKYVASMVAGPSAKHWSYENACWNGPKIIGLGVSLMHCNNVKEREAESDHRMQKTMRRLRAPFLKRYVLVIDTIRKASNGLGGSTGIKQAFHICRGSFATYGPDRPLFGRLVGTFWRPDHVRGDAKIGRIDKQYAVPTPTLSTPAAH